MKRLFAEAGVRDVMVGWTPAQADYFKPIAPPYLLVAMYEKFVHPLERSRLAGCLTVSAER
jgi:hypothetical protein